jgi:hypothetical protein
MIEFRMNHPEDARAVLGKAVQIEQTHLTKIENSKTDDAWLESIFARTLLKEAKALIEGEPQATAVGK